MSSATVDYDNNTVALALQTLGSFDFGGKHASYKTAAPK